MGKIKEFELSYKNEIKEFKENWGQTHSEITANLGYSRKHSESDDLIMSDGYFWINEDKKWYNGNSSLFTDRETIIADYLKSNRFNHLNK